ncbi:hypothetical protein J9B83_02600 [Marinomonas sp. A79]|uniref:Uncharacterized protein n=1 Tax=Marinomonas vulgaris TaxID=2823372 RepID=A0ABS5H7Y6_9GAMM|nr:hypothetical protein [Marinomonas vulgaris]MBR7887817.1 hypothetical protein [Marinomonas vulgaris]
MKYSFGWCLLVSGVVNAQTIERQPVDIIYGDQVIHSQHQVVVSSGPEVAVIPADKSTSTLGPNLVISSDGKTLPYLEQNKIAAREQEIYDEVNQRTEESPFTVLFTGNIPDDIQEKRLRMMPEIGVFADEIRSDGNSFSDGSFVNEADSDVAGSAEISPDAGDFSPIGKGVIPIQPSASEEVEAVEETNEEKLEKLIGG